MNFKSIIGQQAVKKRLIESVINNRISHAQFFLGPDGSGALQLAIAYAQYILCENKSTEDSCGTCNSCQKNLKLIHPDVHFTFPVVREEKAKRPPLSKDYLEEWRSIFQSNHTSV